MSSFAIMYDIYQQIWGITVEYWVIAVAIVGIVLFFFWLLRDRKCDDCDVKMRSLWVQWISIMVMTVFFGRGGWQVKPIIAATAFQHQRHELANLSLNSTFTILRSLKTNQIQSYSYYPDWPSLRNVMMKETSSGPPLLSEKANVVIIVMESFATEYTALGSKSYTPFLDHLSKIGSSYPFNFANGRRSIDALPSILAGLPTLMEDPFITSAFQTSQLRALPQILKENGYTTAFFHGGSRGTMFFDVMAGMFGFERYYGEDSYLDKSQHDGHWGIFDEPFFEFTVDTMSSFDTPFFTTLFSLSSHHPFTIPSQYQGKFPKGTLPIHESIGYADHSLKKFFAKAASQPWFDDTIFIVTADHTSLSEDPKFQRKIGQYRVPLIFYAPGLRLPKYEPNQITEHIDIVPTVLHLLPVEPKGGYLRFGRSLYGHSDHQRAILRGGHGFWFLKKNLAVEITATDEIFYHWQDDYQLSSPLPPDYVPSPDILPTARALLQYYHNGLIEDKLNW